MSDVPAASKAEPLAMICGGGSLPLAVAESVSKSGRRVVLFPIRGTADGLAVERFPHHWIYIGQLSKFLRTARAEGCREVVFIGALVRPSLWRVNPNLSDLWFLLPRACGIPRRRQSYFVEHGQAARGAGFRLTWRA